nr:unnamed protein product [Spirometra erinaceieuropaei]
MFADDVKLWSVIRTELDEERLQADLTRLEKWSQDWLLPFNVTKCNVLRVGRTRSQSRRVYYLNGVPLQEVDAQKDLGVWVTASLQPSLHCSKVVKSAMSVLYLVKGAFSTFDENCFVKDFRTFVRPQLEFAIQAWKPWTSKDLSILEKVQRRVTKLVSGQGSLPFETRLSNLGHFPLSYRQLRGDLIQTFRILRGHDCCLVPADFFELATTTNLRSHPLKLRVTGAKLDIRKFFFSNRVIEAWNALPTDVVMSTSVEFITVFAAYEDIQEGQLVVLFLLHRKLNVREVGVERFLECQHLIPFDDDEVIIHIPGPEFRSGCWKISDSNRCRTASAMSPEIGEPIAVPFTCS